jgi:hypothetical protein
MALPIISADQRLSEQRGIKGRIFGKSGIGKTSLLWTLPEATTLFLDMEAGDLAIEGWGGDTLRPRTWKECRDFAVFIGGANTSLRDDQPYSRKHFDMVCQAFGDPKSLDKYDTVFVDSITMAGRLCFQWCKGEPQAFSDKTGKPNTLGAYGLHGQEMIAWLSHLQHTANKNIWFVGILDEKLDDFNRRLYQPQIEGTKTGLELPGIVDEVITLAELTGQAEDGKEAKPYRAFICHTLNPSGYPAKDRSGRLECVEEPHLGRLMDKIRHKAKPSIQTLTYACPEQTRLEQASLEQPSLGQARLGQTSLPATNNQPTM